MTVRTVICSPVKYAMTVKNASVPTGEKRLEKSKAGTAFG